MENFVLFALLDILNPTKEQLQEYIGVREEEKFPLPLYWRDHLGDYFISEKWQTNAYMAGIVLPDMIILRDMIEPSKRNKELVSTQDLIELAQQIHPLAMPLHFGGSSSEGIVNMLLLQGPKYIETSIMLERYGVKMPSFTEKLAYVAGGEAILAQKNYALRVFQIGQPEQKSVAIKFIDKMLIFIPRK